MFWVEGLGVKARELTVFNRGYVDGCHARHDFIHDNSNGMKTDDDESPLWRSVK